MSIQLLGDVPNAKARHHVGSKRKSLRVAKMFALPHVGILAGASLSAVAWMLPPISSAGKGFVASTPTSTDLFRTIGAYLLIATISGIGYLFGITLSRKLPELKEGRASDLRQTDVWTASIVLSLIGVMIANIIVIRAMGFSGCFHSIITFNANALKFTLYEDYNAGLLSLRYLSIAAAAVAIFRYLAFREFSFRTILSFALLMFVAIVSSRLSLIWAVVIGVVTYLLYPADRPKRNISRSEFFSGAGIVIVLLGALTISRTYGFYQTRGADSVVAAVGSEFQRYLAAPFQGSIESVNNARQRSRLSEKAGIDASLSTNSAFVDFAILIGRWNIIGLSLTLLCSGCMCGILRRYSGTYLILAFGVLQGCHLEIWRISMFHRGVTLTLLAFTLTMPLILNWIRFPALIIPRIRVRV